MLRRLGIEARLVGVSGKSVSSHGIGAADC